MDKPSIVTKGGDEGRTRLFTGQEVSKASVRPEAYGDLDELVSMLGWAKTLVAKPEIVEIIEDLQKRLFRAGAELASDGELYTDPIGSDDVVDMDALASGLESRIQMPEGFILPGGTQAGAILDVSRTIARRLERKVVLLTDQQMLSNPEMLVWINRLSDVLWLCARLEEGSATTLKDG